MYCFPLVDNEETALLHEEATMTIEELLVRYGQNLNKSVKKLGQDATKELENRDNVHADNKGINGETECGASETDSNGKAKLEETAGGSKMRACRRATASCGGSSAVGGSSDGEKAGATADAGPSCSSSAAPTPGSAKSKFFEDSEESEEGEDEEEGSDEEVRRSMFEKSVFDV